MARDKLAHLVTWGRANKAMMAVGLVAIVQLPFSMSSMLPRPPVEIEKARESRAPKSAHPGKVRPEAPAYPSRKDPFAPLAGDVSVTSPASRVGAESDGLPKLAQAFSGTLKPAEVTLPAVPVSVTVKGHKPGPTLQGIVACGEEQLAVFQPTGGQTVYLRKGDKVPPGDWLIKNISDDSVTVERVAGGRSSMRIGIGKSIEG